MRILQSSFVLFSSLPVARAVLDPSNVLQACGWLSQILPLRVSLPQSQHYESSISSYAYLGTRLRPDCVVSPSSTEDVVAIIRTLSKFSSVPFAVRGGGHNTNIGFANVEKGITIDLGSMNDIQFKQSGSIVAVGAGTRSQSVYEGLEPYNLTVQVGRNGDVGVAGFLTGGGIGFYSPERGWACDSVINFEVVLSSGDIVNANATSNADLFTALKGGSNNFGIVTRFDLKTYRQGPLWGGVILYTNSSDQELIAILTAIKNPDNFDPNAMFTFGFMYDATTRTFGADIALYHSRPEKVRGSILELFTKVQPQLYNSVRMGSAGSFAGERLSPVVKPVYMDWATTTFAISPATLTSVNDLFKRTSLALTDRYPSANLTIACSIQSVPAAAPASNPNSLGFDPTSYPEKRLLNIGLAFQFDDPAAAEGLRIANQRFVAEIDQIAMRDGVNDTHLYMNYAGSWQDIFAGYGQESIRKMEQVSIKYDNTGMFQTQVRGGFKLYK